MSKTFLLLSFFAFSHATAQKPDGPTLLFANSNSRLSAAEKSLVYQKLELKQGPDGRTLLSEDFEVDAHVYPTDVNGDGTEDVFIVMSSMALYGNTGQGYALFLKNAAGTYTEQEESGAGIPAILKTKNLGYTDLLIGGPGFQYPALRWNGSAYKLWKQIKDGSAESNSAMALEDYSRAYVAGQK